MPQPRPGAGAITTAGIPAARHLSRTSFMYPSEPVMHGTTVPSCSAAAALAIVHADSVGSVRDAMIYHHSVLDRDFARYVILSLRQSHISGRNPPHQRGDTSAEESIRLRTPGSGVRRTPAELRNRIDGAVVEDERLEICPARRAQTLESSAPQSSVPAATIRYRSSF